MNSNTVITISREFGSGGHLVGEKLAKELGIPFYDNELILLAANESGLGQELFENMEEKPTTSFLYSLSMMSSTAGTYSMPLNDKVFLVQSDTIRKVAEKGPCVIVGRCADYVLENRSNVVNVFIHSPFEKRVERIMQERNLPREKAESTVSKSSKKRATYYNYYTGKKWGDVNNYHLAIDDSEVGIDGAVKLILEYLNHL